jgi:hypothetical protein
MASYQRMIHRPAELNGATWHYCLLLLGKGPICNGRETAVLCLCKQQCFSNCSICVACLLWSFKKKQRHIACSCTRFFKDLAQIINRSGKRSPENGGQMS